MKLILISTVLSAAAAAWVPLDAIEPLARVLAPAIALMATGIFPCMTLTVNSMKGEGRSPALIEQLYEQLQSLLTALTKVFLLAVLCIVALAVTVAIATQQLPVVAVRASIGASTMWLAVLCGRCMALSGAFFALLEVNKKQALLVARAKVRSERESVVEEFKSQRLPVNDPEPRPLKRA